MTTFLATIRRACPTAKSPSVFLTACLCIGSALLGANVAQAAPYGFLGVTGNNLPGNAASTTFMSKNNGVITVSHVFSSPTAVGYADNNNALIYPSDFSGLFPGSGLVQGHLAMTVYGDPNSPLPGGNVNTSRVIFDLTGYFGTMTDLAFGIWNTTDEVALPAYNVQLLDGNSKLVPPTALNYIGNTQNLTQVAGRHKMQLNLSNGDITAPVSISGSVHTDAMFFKGIPAGTQQIIVTANLPPLNNIGDGVGYYFAEPVPEPSSLALAIAGAGASGLLAWRRKRHRPRD